jgi:glyoxylase-like metal-dependent hydrolase (beta-lactamase superfamily II)
VSATRRQFLRAGGAAAGWLAAAGAGAFSCTASAAAPARAGRIATTSLGSGFSLIMGAGANVVALKGESGSLLVDGGLARPSKALLRAAATATGNRRVATLVNTHWHPAQTGSNEAVGKAGGEIIAHEVTKLYLARTVASVDYEGLYGPLAPAGRPTRTTRTSGSFMFGGQQVEYGYLPAAHTNGDLYVHFPAADLLVAGGPVASESWPLLDYRNGAWLGGLVKAHEKLAALVNPGTRVVPADGAPLTGADIKRQHEMFAAFHEQMVVFQNRGMDSGDCIAARPLRESESRYGDATEFIRGAFHSLNIAYSPD